MPTADDDHKPVTFAQGEPQAGWPGRGSVDDAVEFAEHLGALTRTGLPLPSGLRALGAELPRSSLKRVLFKTADRLEAGESLDDAVKGLAGRFPPHLRGLLVSGARSGRLGDVLGQFVRYIRLGASLRRRFWLTLGYPAVLILTLVLLYVFVCVWVVEVFQRILKDFGMTIPPITQALFLLAEVLRERGAEVAIWAGAIGAIAAVVLGSTTGRPARRAILGGIPLVGDLMRWSVLAEYCHLAGLLVESDMPLPEALELAGQGVEDRGLARTGQALKRSVEEGRTLAESLELWPGCPAGLREVLEGSEGRGDLAASLHMAGDMFEARSRTQSAFASSLFAGMTVVLVIWGVGFVLAALYLPVYELFKKLI